MTDPRFAKLKAAALLSAAGLVVVLGVGLYAARQFLRPYDVPEFSEIDTSESAFLIPLDGDAGNQAAFPSAELLDQRKVAVKRVQIAHRWQEAGRLPGQGHWVPSVRLVKVDRRPVTRQWTKAASSGTSAKDEAITAETKESVNFSMGVTCTAHIPEEQAATFLYSYPSKSLADMLDVEVRGRVQQVLAEEAGKYTLEQLPAKKNDVMQAVRADVVPFFEKRGIQVSSIGMYGGITYDNPEIQRTIDEGAKAVQLKVVAEAKREAALVDNARQKQEAEARAAAALTEAKGKADADLLTAESQSKVKVTVAKSEAEAQAARAEAEARARKAVAEAELVATEAQAKVKLAMAKAETEAEAVRAEGQARVRVAGARADAEAKQAAAEAEAAGLKALAEVRVYEAKEAAAGSGGDVYVRLRQLEAEAARWKGWDGKFPTTWMPVGEKATPFAALFPAMLGMTAAAPLEAAAATAAK